MTATLEVPTLGAVKVSDYRYSCHNADNQKKKDLHQGTTIEQNFDDAFEVTPEKRKPRKAGTTQLSSYRAVIQNSGDKAVVRERKRPKTTVVYNVER